MCACVCTGMHTCTHLPHKALSCSLGWFQLPDPVLSLAHTSSCVGTRTFSEPCPQSLSRHPGTMHPPSLPCSHMGSSGAPLPPQLPEVTSAGLKGDKGD